MKMTKKDLKKFKAKEEKDIQYLKNKGDFWKLRALAKGERR